MSGDLELDMRNRILLYSSGELEPDEREWVESFLLQSSSARLYLESLDSLDELRERFDLEGDSAFQSAAQAEVPGCPSTCRSLFSFVAEALLESEVPVDGDYRRHRGFSGNVLPESGTGEGPRDRVKSAVRNLMNLAAGVLILVGIGSVYRVITQDRVITQESRKTQDHRTSGDGKPEGVEPWVEQGEKPLQPALLAGKGVAETVAKKKGPPAVVQQTVGRKWNVTNRKKLRVGSDLLAKIQNTRSKMKNFKKRMVKRS
ncbi:MAG: hypothetical protein VX768_05320 [Planctomycetota bacterium]|nr:hypothetical protein [Planctomycetota bacterium]